MYGAGFRESQPHSVASRREIRQWWTATQNVATRARQNACPERVFSDNASKLFLVLQETLQRPVGSKLITTRRFTSKWQREIPGVTQLLNGAWSSVPLVEIRQLNAVVVLAEELNFTKAAQRLHISQPALSKQITDLEAQYDLQLFLREKGRVLDLTDAGRAFVADARVAVFRAERAVHSARAASEGYDRVLIVGHSSHADQAWLSAILAIRLPSYPRLKIRFATRFGTELVRGVLTGELNLALVTAPPPDPTITSVPFASAPVYAALPLEHLGVHKKELFLQDLSRDEWILCVRDASPMVHDAIMETARVQSIGPKDAHGIHTADQAIYLVSEHVGVAIIAEPTTPKTNGKGVVIKPLSDKSLQFQTCLVMSKDDDSRLTNEFARAFLRRYAPQRVPPKQMNLPLSEAHVSEKASARDA